MINIANTKPKIDKVRFTMKVVNDTTVTNEFESYVALTKKLSEYIGENRSFKPGGRGKKKKKNRIWISKPQHGYVTIALYPEEIMVTWLYDLFKWFKEEYNLPLKSNLKYMELAFDFYPNVNSQEVCEKILLFVKDYIDICSNYMFLMDYKEGELQYKRDCAVNGRYGYYIWKNKKGNLDLIINDDVKSQYATNFNIYPKCEEKKWFIRFECRFKVADITKFSDQYGKDKFERIKDFFDYIKQTKYTDIFCFSKIDYDRFIKYVENYNFDIKIKKNSKTREYYLNNFYDLNKEEIIPICAINQLYKIKKIAKILNLTTIRDNIFMFKETIPIDYINSEISKLDH